MSTTTYKPETVRITYPLVTINYHDGSSKQLKPNELEQMQRNMSESDQIEMFRQNRVWHEVSDRISVHQYDSNGKKHGWSICYFQHTIDNNDNVIQVIESARFYEHGIMIKSQLYKHNPNSASLYNFMPTKLKMIDGSMKTVVNFDFFGTVINVTKWCNGRRKSDVCYNDEGEHLTTLIHPSDCPDAYIKSVGDIVDDWKWMMKHRVL